MLSKSISDRSAPHHGMGRAWKCLRAFNRNLRIHGGSDFIEEISSTTCSDRPLFGSKTECPGSLQPNRYPLLSSLRCSSCVTAIRSAPLGRDASPACRGVPPESLHQVYSGRKPKVHTADRIQDTWSKAE